MADRTVDVAVQVRQLFDAKAATWPSKYSPNGRLAPRLTRLASAVTHRVPAGGSVLDIGCGTGELARVLAAAGMRVTGCDISLKMLRNAGAADPSGAVNWIRLDTDWRELPFEPETFDAVVASSVLEYVQEPTSVLRECGRVLRPGGSVLCTVPNLRHPVRWLEWLLGVTCRVELLRTVGRRWLRLDGYLTYLLISQKRHSSCWWRTAAAHSGLLDVRYPTNSSERSSLCLLTFLRGEK
jgi:2-polyprenyl-3-methyl-5-hydroxy-6-metoxy-1,4-benzoquinol methylase